MEPPAHFHGEGGLVASRQPRAARPPVVQRGAGVGMHHEPPHGLPAVPQHVGLRLEGGEAGVLPRVVWGLE